LLERQLAQVEPQKREIEARLHTAEVALKRLGSFVAVRGSDLQCPSCWINDETVASLRRIGGGTQSADLYRCNTCEATLL